MSDEIKISDELRNFWKQEEEANSPTMRQSLMENINKELATQMVEKWENTVKEVFLRKTGEELTMDKVDRVQIIKVINDPNEYYHIDGKLAITLYPLDMNWPLVNEMYKVTVSRNYKEHE